MARLPASVGAMIPESGVAPVTTEVGVRAGEDLASPTSLVLRYLTSRGFQPSTENVRRVLEANARDPSLIPELRGSPGPATGGVPTGARGGGRSLPEPPIPPDTGGGPSAVMDRRDNATTSAPPPSTASTPPATVVSNPPPPNAVPPDTEVPPSVRSSATPSAVGSDGIPLGYAILAGAPAAAALGGGVTAAMQAAAARNPPIPEVGVGGSRLTPDPSIAPPPPDPATLFPAGSASTQRPPDPALRPTAAELSTAIDKAVAPPEPLVSGVNPVPPGVAARPPGGPTAPVAGADVPVVPFTPNRVPPNAAARGMLPRNVGRLFRSIR